MSKQELINKADYYKKLLADNRGLSSEKIKELCRYFKLGFIYSSNAIEGNTVSIEETKALLEEGFTKDSNFNEDFNAILGHAEAYDYFSSLVLEGQVEITEELIRKLHYLYYRRIDPKMAGQYRNTYVNATAMDYIPPNPEDLAHLMEHFINQMQSSKRLLHPIEYAALCHKRLMDIHPFEEGNGVVARLLMNIVLINEGYGMALISPEKRDEYINGLVLSRRKNIPDIDPLVKLITECLVNTQAEYCKLLNLE